jgi:signal transduction histidine kinase
MGIPEKDLPLIFEEFYKIESDTEYGTGLGLYLSKKIIDMHKGYIKVESKVGKGSKFSFELPKVNTDNLDYIEGS